MAVRDTRTDFAAGPVFTAEFVQEFAAKNAVCVRPLLRQVTDRESGEVQRLVIPCGSTRESVCPACADKARRVRMQQCAEGWHLAEEPLHDAAEDYEPLGYDEPLVIARRSQVEGEQQLHGRQGRRLRSTRRRLDVEDLPRSQVEYRSVGRTFTARDGTKYRPSMFVTLTLGSYGKVVPAKPGTSMCGAGAPRSRTGTTTVGLRLRRCSSRGSSTDGCRTCVDVRGTWCSTSARSNLNGD